MALIRLGLPGLEYVLPDIKYPAGSEIELPVECSRSVEEAKMADGSLRFNILPLHPLGFRLEFDRLTWTEVEFLLSIVTLNKELSYINEYNDGVAYAVVVTAWGYTPIASTTGLAVPRYRFTLELRGTGGINT